MSNNKRLAIVSTHPVQYYAPVFRMIAENPSIQLMVFYTWGQAGNEKYDPGFGKVISWDVPVLDGYDYTFLENTSKNPGTGSFSGIENPDNIRVISNWNPDFLLVFGWSWKSHFQIIRHFHGKIPVWFRGDSHLLDPIQPVKYFFRKFFLSWVYRHIDHAFAVGTANRDYFLWAGLKSDQISIMPHTIDVSRFSSLSNDQLIVLNQLRDSLALNSEGPVFLFAGKFQKKKGISDLAEAFLSIDHPSARLLLVGSGELLDEIKQKCQEDKRITFLPFQNQQMMPLIYRLAHWFVYPSRGPGETWGLAVNEALSAGIPCIVSDKVGCHPDLIQSSSNGFVFPAGNSNRLKEILLDCIHSFSSEIYSDRSGLLLPESYYPENAITILIDKVNQ